MKMNPQGFDPRRGSSSTGKQTQLSGLQFKAENIHLLQYHDMNCGGLRESSRKWRLFNFKVVSPCLFTSIEGGLWVHARNLLCMRVIVYERWEQEKDLTRSGELLLLQKADDSRRHRLLVAEDTRRAVCKTTQPVCLHLHAGAFAPHWRWSRFNPLKFGLMPRALSGLHASKDGNEKLFIWFLCWQDLSLKLLTSGVLG